MSTEQKHNAIREALANLGYLVRKEGSFALCILPKLAAVTVAA